PLVNPVSGYSTLVRLVRTRLRPSTSTSTLPGSGLMSVAPPGRLRSRERLPVSPTLAPIRQNDNPPDRGPPGNRRPGPVSRRGDLSGAVIHKNRSGVYTVGPWQFADRCTRTARVYASRPGRDGRARGAFGWIRRYPQHSWTGSQPAGDGLQLAGRPGE